MSWGELSCKYCYSSFRCPNPKQSPDTCNESCEFYTKKPFKLDDHKKEDNNSWAETQEEKK